MTISTSNPVCFFWFSPDLQIFILIYFRRAFQSCFSCSDSHFSVSHFFSVFKILSLKSSHKFQPINSQHSAPGKKHLCLTSLLKETNRLTWREIVRTLSSESDSTFFSVSRSFLPEPRIVARNRTNRAWKWKKSVVFLFPWL